MRDVLSGKVPLRLACADHDGWPRTLRTANSRADIRGGPGENPTIRWIDATDNRPGARSPVQGGSAGVLALVAEMSGEEAVWYHPVGQIRCDQCPERLAFFMVPFHCGGSGQVNIAVIQNANPPRMAGTVNSAATYDDGKRNARGRTGMPQKWQRMVLRWNTVIESRLDRRAETISAPFRAARAPGALDKLYAGLPPAAVSARSAAGERGQMPLRERITMALDKDSPFLEISPLAAWRSNFNIGSGFVVGIGVISGVECVILGHDPSVRAGAFNAFNGKKLMRGLEIARLNRMPYVQFVESAGADLRGDSGETDPEAAIRREVGHFAESGRLFYEITELSKMRIPTISVVFGARLRVAHQPGMSDNIFIRGQSKVFLKADHRW